MVKISRLGLVVLLLGAEALALGKKEGTIVYQNTTPGVAFTGSKSCASPACHGELCRRYFQTPHGDSMGPANAPSELAKVPQRITVHQKKFDRSFDVVRVGPDLYQTEYQLDTTGGKLFSTAQTLAYRIGGHLTGNVYIIRWGQNFFEAPLAYYVRVNQWDLAPGYEDALRPFNRPIIHGGLSVRTKPRWQEGVQKRADKV